MNTTVRITLDIHKIGSQAVIPVFQGDSGYTIIAHLTESGKPFHIEDGCIASFQSIKPNGDCLGNACRIENNAIVYDFKQNNEKTCQTTSVVGTSNCQFKLIGTNGGILASPFFNIVVNKCVYNENEKIIIESAPEYTALTEYVATLEQRVKNGDFNGEKGDKGDPGEVTYDELEKVLKPYATREDVGSMLKPYATSDELEEKTSSFIPCTKVDTLPEASEDTKNKVYEKDGSYYVVRGGGTKGYEVGQTYGANDKVQTSLTEAELTNLLNGLSLGYDTSVELFSVRNNMASETWTFYWYQANDNPDSTSFCASMWNPAEYQSVGDIYDLINGGFTFDELNSTAGSGPTDGGFTITNITELGQQIFGGSSPRWFNLLTGEEAES